MDAGSANVQLLKAKGRPIGLAPGGVYVREGVVVPPGTRLYLFSDGVFEVQRPDGTMTTFEEFVDFIKGAGSNNQSDLDLLFEHLMQIRGGGALEDDFSIVRFAL
jgi:sigma-B regulation protein RsbU (phosphoserine phosphatase)